MAYRLTHMAAEDITANFTEVAHRFGLDQADKYHVGLERIFLLIPGNPELTRNRLGISPPVRVYHYGSHLLFTWGFNKQSALRRSFFNTSTRSAPLPDLR